MLRKYITMRANYFFAFLSQLNEKLVGSRNYFVQPGTGSVSFLCQLSLSSRTIIISRGGIEPQKKKFCMQSKQRLLYDYANKGMILRSAKSGHKQMLHNIIIVRWSSNRIE